MKDPLTEAERAFVNETEDDPCPYCLDPNSSGLAGTELVRIIHKLCLRVLTLEGQVAQRIEEQRKLILYLDKGNHPTQETT